MPNAADPVAQHAKKVMAMRYFLLGREYHAALAAMEFARGLTTGFRKNGVDPSFSHQIYIGAYLRTILPGLMHKEETLATVFLHDVCEDHDVGFEEIAARFGDRIARSTRLLTKKHRGVAVPYETYFSGMAGDPIASLVKGADRAHNIFTMSAAGWTIDKQTTYLDEVDRWFLPMLKTARRSFPQQEPAYENVKTMLAVQSAPIRLTLEHARLYGPTSGQEGSPESAAPTP